MLDTDHSRQKFKKALDDSLAKRRVYLRNRQEFLQQMVGSHWGPNAGAVDVPINAIHRGFVTYTRMLASRAPQMMIRTQVPHLRATANDAEVLLNEEIEKSDLERKLRRWVGASLFGLGILKVGLRLKESSFDEFGNEQMIGELMTRNISLDDYVHDMSARALEADEIDYLGHKFRVPLEEAKNNPLYSAKVRKMLSATKRLDNDKKGNRRAEAMGAANKIEAVDHIDLWELYYPRENVVVVFDDELKFDPLREETWSGPDSPTSIGPYHHLYYTEVEDQSMPLPPAAVWIDIHKVTNQIYNKEADSAQESKTILTYNEGGEDDAQAVVESSHMEVVAVANVDGLKEITFNGARSENLGFMLQSLELLDDAQGNLNLLAGTEAQSATATQDSMLRESASAATEDMKEQVYKQTKGVMEHWAFHYWHDPQRTYQSVRQIPDTDIFVPAVLTPEDRENNWANFNFDIVPYSMQRRSPAQIAAELDKMMLEFLLQAPDILQAQGLAPDIQEYLRLKAKYMNLPELLRLVRTDSGQNLESKTEIGRKPQNTNRTYTRKNVSMGPTRKAARQQSIQQLFGMANNNQQAGNNQ